MENSFQGAMVIFSIILIVLISTFLLPPVWLFTLYLADMVICGAFAWDFVSRFCRAPQKSSFLKSHGYEALAAVPVVAFYPLPALSGLAAGFRATKMAALLLTPERISSLKNVFGWFVQKSRLLWKLPPPP
jgi:hypothetical protein